MSQSISISVPMTYNALRSASDMLSKIAHDIVTEEEKRVTVLSEDQLKPELELEAKQVFAPVADVPAPPVPPAPDYDTVGEAFDAEDAENGELDANGLSWDARIHAATKTKDVNGRWKYKRGIDRDVLVPEVEAELRALVGEPVADDGNWDAAPGAPTGTIIPAPPAAPSTSVKTFAQLVTGITANSIPEEKVNTALAAVGLQNFALLGARADLIPTVAGRLGL